MKNLFDEQIKLFETILGRELVEDEKYLVRNAFHNGVNHGAEIARTKIIAELKRMT